MKTPTSAQQLVLESIHHQAARIAVMIETETTRQRLTGEAPSLEWVDSYNEQALRGEALETVAAAGGVPLKWIAHVHDRGRAGLRWRADQYLPGPEPVDWDRVLGGLSADVARLQQWTALDVSFCVINPGVYRRVAEAMERNLRVLRARTTGVANLLGIDREVGHQLWGTTADWASAGADAIGWLSHQAVADRWTVAAHSDTRDYLRQTYALHVAGIDTINTVALASASELAAAIRPILDSSAQQPSGQGTAGEEIELALTAAAPPTEVILSDGTHTGATLFSTAIDTPPSYPGPEEDREIPLPRFSSAVEGAEP